MTRLLLFYMLLAAVGHVRAELSEAEMERIRKQAVLAAMELLSPGTQNSALPLSLTPDAPSEAVASFIEKAANRIEAHLLKQASMAAAKDTAARRRSLLSTEEDSSLRLEDTALEAQVPEALVNGLPVSRPRRSLLALYAATRPTTAEAESFCNFLPNAAINIAPGRNIPYAFIATTDPGQCCAACMFRLDCFAWTVKAKLANGNGCYLRGAAFNNIPRPQAGWTSGKMYSRGDWVPPPAPPPFKPLKSGKGKYTEVLKLTSYFFMAQRSGRERVGNPIKWRNSSHVRDRVPGGFYDAGDTLKSNFPLGVAASFMAWSLVTFPKSFAASSSFGSHRALVREALDYMLACYDERNKRFVGQIGDPNVDLRFWGRPEQGYVGPRPAYVWDRTKHASDLLSNVAAAWASGAVLFKGSDPAYANLLRAKAASIYAWAKSNEGRYSDYYRSATYTLYPSYDFLDNQAWAAAWMFRATGKLEYLRDAESFWKRSYGVDTFKADVFPGWDSLWAPTAAMMRQISRRGVTVPGITMYSTYFNKQFVPSWLNANGGFDIVRTPKGLVHPAWNTFSNFQFSTTAAMCMIQDAVGNRDITQKRREIAFARRQVDYVLGSTGRSYIVGWGASPPVNVHHPAASCPKPPAPCNQQNQYMKAKNPNILYGAMVGGPSGKKRYPTKPDYYFDRRSDFSVNEPSVDAMAGLMGALAGVYGYS